MSTPRGLSRGKVHNNNIYIMLVPTYNIDNMNIVRENTKKVRAISL